MGDGVIDWGRMGPETGTLPNGNGHHAANGAGNGLAGRRTEIQTNSFTVTTLDSFNCK